MKNASLLRFMGKVDQTLQDLFPALIRIGGVNYQATGVGGAAAMEYLDEGGQAPTGMRVFRVQKSFLARRPESGTQVEWVSTPGSPVTRLTVIDCPDRPHETAWVLRCLPTDR